MRKIYTWDGMYLSMPMNLPPLHMNEWMNVMLYHFLWQPLFKPIQCYALPITTIGYLCQLKLNLCFAFINWHLSRFLVADFGFKPFPLMIPITNSFACREEMTFYCTKSCKQYFNRNVKLQMEHRNCLLKWNE